MKKFKWVLYSFIIIISLHSCETPSRFTVGTTLMAPIRVRPPFPGEGFIWIEGEWFWNGGNYAWRDGYWSRPMDRYRWQPGLWQRRGNNYHWKPGRWR